MIRQFELPDSFGPWSATQGSSPFITNPVVDAVIENTYGRVISKIYRNRQGDRVDFMVAYAARQKDGLQVHFPEVCYPAQGFRIVSSEDVTLLIGERRLSGRFLHTESTARAEFVTYWTLLGDYAALSAIQRKQIELQYGFEGFIADGALIRISSPGRDKNEARLLHRQFAEELFQEIPNQEAKAWMLGLN